MRSFVLSVAALAGLAVGAGTADAQFVRRGVLYAPGFYAAPVAP